MKTKILTLLFLCLPVLVDAQNYEQQGDELYKQAKYEQAIKKYNAAVELGEASSQVSQKVQNAKKCISLSTAAASAENNNSYSQALELYTQLFELNSISQYKGKIALYRKMLNEAEQARLQKENAELERAAQAKRAERERQAKIEAEQKAKLEAERKAKIEKERREREQKAAREREATERRRQALNEQNKSRLVITRLLSHPLGIESVDWIDAVAIQKKAIFDKYPQLKKSSKNNCITGVLDTEITLYYRSIHYVLINYMKDEIYVRYTIEAKSSQLRNDLFDDVSECFASSTATMKQENRRVEKDKKCIKCKRLIGSPSKQLELTIEFLVE